MKQVETLKFKKFCMSIGNLPSSYVESLSYYECLLWLIKFLQEQVIPTVNNNSEVVKELQNLYIQLKNYVDNYFDNLDVQEEINNKLDEMLEDGVLEQIIEQFVQSTALWCFDTVADMKLATNFTNGSYAKTMGYYSKNDGGSSTYKIRTKTEDDVIDDSFIVSLYDDTLVAELIYFDEINVLQVGAKGDGETNDTSKIQLAIDKIHNKGGGKVILPTNTYLVDTVTEDTYNYCLKLYSNIELCGKGTIKLNPSNDSGDNAIITTLITDDYNNIYIHDLTIDGSCDNIEATRHLSNICLFNASKSTIENVKSINANYCGIMIRADEIGHCTDNKIINNNVYNCKYIGIQESYNNNIIISNNIIDTTVDNAIDCYANDTSAYATTYNTIVTNNNIYRCKKVGIFLESLKHVICSDNSIYCCLRGIAINRINSGVLDSIITNNNIDCGYDVDSSIYGETGIIILNNDYYNKISNNLIQNCTNPFNVGNCSYCEISNNNFKKVNGDYLIKLRNNTTNLFIRNKISDNNMVDSTNYNKLLISPIGIGCSNPSRTSNLTIYNNYQLITASLIPTELYSGVFTLTNNGSWSNCTIYYGGVTLINVSRDSGTSIVVGDYLYANNTWFKVSALVGAQVTVTNTSDENGDYTSNFTTSAKVYKFTPSEYTKVIND